MNGTPREEELLRTVEEFNGITIRVYFVIKKIIILRINYLDDS